MKNVRMLDPRLLIGIIVALLAIGCGTNGIDGPVPTASIRATQNPLVAEYDVTQFHAGATAWAEFGLDTNYGRQTSVSAATTGPSQTIKLLVAGMKPSTTYHMRAHATWNNVSWVDEDRTFTTGSLSSVGLVAPPVKMTSPNPGLTPSPGVELFDGFILGPPDPSLLASFVTDLQGNVIWYYPSGAAGIKFMPDGYVVANLAQDLREFDLAGNTIHDVSLAQVNQSLQAHGYGFQVTGFHHDVLRLPNAHWIGLCNILKSFTDLQGFPGVTNVLSDVLVDVDDAGDVVWAWSAFDHLDVNRHPWGLGTFAGAGASGADWTHGNAVQYTEDGNLILSMRDQSWIIKIDYENGTGSGAVLWRLGYQGDFAIEGGDSKDWFYGQHNPSIISTNGSQMLLSVWDNGNNRVQADGSTCGEVGASCYSRPTIFQIDEDTKIAQLVWQDRPNMFSFWGGSIEALSNGNVEFDLSDPFLTSSSRVLEVTQTSSPQTVLQIDITGENAYRAFRIPSLYPDVTWIQ
jgi:hypothetical protein